MTVISKPPTGAAASRAFNAPAAEADKGATGTFEAMLDNEAPGPAVPASTSSKPAATRSESGNNSVEGAPSGSADSDPKDAEAVAAAIDAAVPIVDQLETGATLTGLVNDLAALKQSLDAGEAIAPELLERIAGSLDSLSAQLGIDLSALSTPSLADLAGLAQAAQDGELTTAARLSAAMAPLAQTLLAGATEAADAAQLLQSIGDKLAKLAQALDAEDGGSGDLAKLNLQADSQADAELAAAISKLLAKPAPQDADLAGPALAAPKLSLTETALAGKGADAGIEPTPTTDSVDTAEAPRLGAEAKGDPADSDARPKKDNDQPPAETKANAAAATTVNEIREDGQGVTQATATAARVDAAAPRVIHAGYQTSQQQLNLPQLAFELARQVGDGNTRFQIRLDPAELGKIDVRLDIDASGQVNARMTVEKAETLDLMQRDQRALERALQQAGLDASKTNLEFSLKQNPFGGGQQQARDDQGQLFGLDGTRSDDADDAPLTVNLYRASLTASGVNIIA